MAENFFAPFHEPEGFCPEYKTVIPHPSTSWKLLLGILVGQKLKLNISNPKKRKDEIAFETKDVLLSKKFCSKYDVFCFQIKKVLFCYKGELILTEALSQNRDWARGILAMINMPLLPEFILLWKNDAGKTKRFKIL